MARLLGPDMGSRLVILPSGYRGAGLIGTVYSNAGGTILADILAYQPSVPGTPGAAIVGSAITTDAYGLLPWFWFPDGLVDRVWISVNGGPLTPIDADYNARQDAIEVRVTAIEPAGSAVALRASSNLADLASVVAARTNLGVAYGATVGTVAQGNDSRLSDARTPTTHATTHQPGGADPMAVDALPAVASLRTLGTGAQQATAGSDVRLSDARTPTAHAATHASAGADPLTLAESQVTNLVSDLAAKAPTTRAITAGTGITGGGTLAADRTFALTQDVREYTANQANIPTPAGITGAYVTAICGGSGGGSGRRGAAATVRCGGGGGGTAMLNDQWVPAIVWGATYTVTIGTGGAGGAARTVDSTDGATGAAGGTSSVNTGAIIIRATAPGAGLGGTATTGSGGGPGGPTGGTGASASTTGGAGATAGASLTAPGGGGSGGGITSADVAGAGGIGGVANVWAGGSGGAGGVVGGANPVIGTSAALPLAPNGSGGGAASITAAAQAGADGASYGGGGGGGGASLNGFNSGAGGAGGPGYIRIRFQYA